MVKKSSLRISRKIILVATSVATLLCYSLANGSYENSTAIGVKEKKERFNFVNIFSYGVSSDALDNNDRKVFNHGLSYDSTVFIDDKYYANARLAASYHSVDTAIVEDDNGSFRASDLVASVGTKGLLLHKSKDDSIKLFNNIRNVFPLSEKSRNEGYKSVPSTTADLAYQRGPLGVVLSGQYAYVVNSYETNLSGLYNLSSSTVGGLTLRYNYKKFRFQYTYRMGVLEYTDGQRAGASGNSVSLTAMFYKNMWAGLSTSNLHTVEDQFIDVWFFDPYRRIYNLRLGVTF